MRQGLKCQNKGQKLIKKIVLSSKIFFVIVKKNFCQCPCQIFVFVKKKIFYCQILFLSQSKHFFCHIQKQVFFIEKKKYFCHCQKISFVNVKQIL